MFLAIVSHFRPRVVEITHLFIAAHCFARPIPSLLCPIPGVRTTSQDPNPTILQFYPTSCTLDITYHHRYCFRSHYFLPINIVYLFDHFEVVRRLAFVSCHAAVWLCDDALVLYHLPLCPI
jgi:hypothetical protein